MNTHIASSDPGIAQDAIAWFVRQQAGDMATDDWLAFSEWLGENDVHAAIFDEVVAGDGRLAGLDVERLAGPEAEGSGPAGYRSGRSFWWVAASIAAVLVLAVLIWPRGAPATFVSVATGPGETRSLALTDTISIEINGSTSLQYLQGKEPVVRLESGEAAFYVNSPRPSALRVEVGGLVLTDRGTSFDVIRDGFGTRIAVGSGLVQVDSGAEQLELAAGQRLDHPAKGGEPRVGSIAPADMAGWRSGSLAFRDESLPVVASDLGRALGVDIAIGQELSKKRFTGVLPVAGSQEEAITAAATLFGAEARRKGQGWAITRP